MKILYLADIRFPLERANGIQTAETCHALARRGHDVTLLVRPDTASPPREPWSYYDLPPIETLRVERVAGAVTPVLRRARYVAESMRRAATARPAYDVVFTRDLGVAAALLGMPKRIRPPLIYEAHGIASLVGASLDSLLTGAAAASSRKQRRLLRRDERVWRAADGYVTITATLGDDLARRFGARGAVAVVPDGTRLRPDRQFDPPAPRDRPVVTYAGHLYPWKGVDGLLRALSAVPSAIGVIVGGHPAESDLERLRRLARDLGLEARVRFVGHVPPADVGAHLRAADILVLPNRATTVSARYTSPLKLFEYLEAGRAIIAADLPALREILHPDREAVLVPPDDEAALAAAITRLARDHALRERLGRAAFDAAPAFSWDRRAARLEAVLDAAVGDGIGAPSAPSGRADAMR